MTQDTVHRDRRLIINGGTDNLVGIGARTTNQDSAYYAANRCIRQSWDIVDKFRGVMAYYITSYGGPSDTDFSRYTPLNYAVGDPESFAYQNKRQALFVTPAETLQSIPGTSQDALVETYLIEPDNPSWNLLKAPPGGSGGVTHNLLKKYIQDPGINEGDPYFGKYLENGFVVADLVGAAAGQELAPVFNRLGAAQSFIDHTFAYWKPSDNEVVRSDPGDDLNISVESVYNFFMDTSPTYESVTADVPEALLPNYYILEGELRNTSSAPLSQEYYNCLTLWGRISDWLEEVDGGFTETTSKSYYQTYVTALNSIKDNATDYTSLKSQFNLHTKNIAVLYKDIDIINQRMRSDDETNALSRLPFYNVVTIGNDDYSSTANGSQVSSWITDNLINNISISDTGFLDLLQLHIINNIERSVEGIKDFNIFGNPSQPAPGGGAERGLWTQSTGSNKLYFNLADPDSGIYTKASGETTGTPNSPGFLPSADTLATRVNSSDYRAQPSPNGLAYWHRDNRTLLRTPQNFKISHQYEEDAANPPSVDPLGIQEFYDQVVGGTIVFPQRTYPQVCDNVKCQSETILYQINKRVVSSEGVVSPNVVQRIYLSPRFDGAPLEYIDSQIKYGVAYQYDIQQIRLVFGNKYYYDDLKLFYAGYGGYGRAVGNALGFYRPVNSAMVADTYAANLYNDYLTPTATSAGNTPIGATHSGYFVFQASPSAGAVGDYMILAVSGSEWGDSSMKDRINLTIKGGWGLEGNSTGGALSDQILIPDLDGSGLAPGIAVDPMATVGVVLSGEQLILTDELATYSSTGLRELESDLVTTEGAEALQETQDLQDLVAAVGESIAEDIAAEIMNQGRGGGMGLPGVPGVLHDVLAALQGAGGGAGGAGPYDPDVQGDQLGGLGGFGFEELAFGMEGEMNLGDLVSGFF